ncbi:unnamed protein product [Ectocarpus sp. 12 AP-2014]
MIHAATGWPTLDHRLRFEPTPCFSIISSGAPPSQAPSSSSRSGGGGRNVGDNSGSGHGCATASAGTQAGAAGLGQGYTGHDDEIGVICVDVVCPYTRALVMEGLKRRRGAWRVTKDTANATLHWGDYEMIDWERVVSGELRASSYCVRKGLSRKAQLSRYCNKYTSKRPGTPLEAAMPRTLVIDTWEAFDDDMTFNLGGDIAAFGSDLGVRQSVSLETRLDWCLGDAQEWIEQDRKDDEADEEGGGGVTAGEEDVRRAGTKEASAPCPDGEEGKGATRRRWILKPSTLNKGAGLALGEDFETLRRAIHDSPDIREWVLQEYVERPLLAEGRKFHLRAYALAVGCIQVYLYDTVLLLRAAKRYPVAGSGGGGDAFADEDALAHITNTARQSEDATFREEDNVWVLDDLIGELERLGRSPDDARAKVDGIMADMRSLTTDLFRAFRGEFAVFSPLPGCFEHFGLDFLVDEDFHVWLLEANPGPDFKQTGSRLKPVIGGLIEGSMRLCLDDVATTGGDKSGSGPAGTRSGFSLVLDEQWRGTSSAPSMKMV